MVCAAQVSVWNPLFWWVCVLLLHCMSCYSSSFAPPLFRRSSNSSRKSIIEMPSSQVLFKWICTRKDLKFRKTFEIRTNVRTTNWWLSLLDFQVPILSFCMATLSDLLSTQRLDYLKEFSDLSEVFSVLSRNVLYCTRYSTVTLPVSLTKNRGLLLPVSQIAHRDRTKDQKWSIKFNIYSNSPKHISRIFRGL